MLLQIFGVSRDEELCSLDYLFWIYLFFRLLASVGITQTIPPSGLSVILNNTFTLACYIEGNPTPSVSWTKVGGKINSRTKGRISNVFKIGKIRAKICCFVQVYVR